MKSKAWLLFFALVAGCSDSGPDKGHADVLEVSDVMAETDASKEVSEGHYPPTATAQQVAALLQVNRFRAATGLDPVDEDEALNKAAQAHAEFIVKNCANYAATGLSPHEEDPSWPGFTGVNFWDRVAHAGYSGGFGGAEVIAFENNPTAAVTGWMNTLYHRLPITDPATVEVGYGNAGIGGGQPCSMPMLKKADVMDTATGPVVNDQVVLYPPDGAMAVPTSFDGYESPQPPPPPGGFPSGYIVTVQFAKATGFRVTHHEILENGETPLPHRFLAPYADPDAGVDRDQLLGNALALYTHRPLSPNTEYTVTISLVRGGEQKELRWSFKTGSR